tara:strand:- start:98 stop:241 length:144 start_codon:yes stop_codon:yes gene_type:complete
LVKAEFNLTVTNHNKNKVEVSEADPTFQEEAQTKVLVVDLHQDLLLP